MKSDLSVSVLEREVENPMVLVKSLELFILTGKINRRIFRITGLTGK